MPRSSDYGNVYMVVTDVFRNVTRWLPSSRCAPTCGVNASCCYPEPEQQSYACFGVTDCSEIHDESLAAYTKVTRSMYAHVPAAATSTTPLLCNENAGYCLAQRPVLGAGTALYQHVQLENGTGVLLSHERGANGSITTVGTCRLPRPMAGTFSGAAGTLFGFDTADAVTVLELSPPGPNATGACALRPHATLPLPIFNLSVGWAASGAGAMGSFAFNRSDGTLYYSPVSNGHRSLLALELATGAVRSKWSVSEYDHPGQYLTLDELQIDVSGDRLLIGGGWTGGASPIRCGGDATRKCAIALEPATGEQHYLFLEGGGVSPASRLADGIGKYGSVPGRTLMVWQACAGLSPCKPWAQPSDFLQVLDWSRPAGEQVVLNSSRLALPCLEGAYQCVGSDLVLA
jgi:hypothetical protein